MAKKKQAATATASPAPATGAARTASASSAHQALVTTGILLAFVVIMTMIAGIGPNAGKLSAALMVALIILQGLGHVNPFVKWAANHPLTPNGPTFTVNKGN